MGHFREWLSLLSEGVQIDFGDHQSEILAGLESQTTAGQLATKFWDKITLTFTREDSPEDLFRGETLPVSVADSKTGGTAFTGSLEFQLGSTMPTVTQLRNTMLRPYRRLLGARERAAKAKEVSSDVNTAHHDMEQLKKILQGQDNKATLGYFAPLGFKGKWMIGRQYGDIEAIRDAMQTNSPSSRKNPFTGKPYSLPRGTHLIPMVRLYLGELREGLIEAGAITDGSRWLRMSSAERAAEEKEAAEINLAKTHLSKLGVFLGYVVGKQIKGNLENPHIKEILEFTVERFVSNLDHPFGVVLVPGSSHGANKVIADKIAEHLIRRFGSGPPRKIEIPKTEGLGFWRDETPMVDALTRLHDRGSTDLEELPEGVKEAMREILYFDELRFFLQTRAIGDVEALRNMIRTLKSEGPSKISAIGRDRFRRFIRFLDLSNMRDIDTGTKIPPAFLDAASVIIADDNIAYGATIDIIKSEIERAGIRPTDIKVFSPLRIEPKRSVSTTALRPFV